MKRFLLSLLLALPLLSTAQQNYQKGYVVTNSKDTLRGYIDYRERNANPSSFNFKAENGSIQKYTLSDCVAYGIDDMDAFERYEVDKTLSKILTAELSSGPDLTTVRDTVFLKVLQAGKNVTLYSYSDEIKERFYIKENDTAVPQELIRQLYLKPDQASMIVTDDKYVRQLLLIMRKINGGISDQEKKLVTLDYKAQDLKKLTALMNGQELIKSKYPRSRVFAGAGLMISKASYQGDNAFASENTQSKTSYLPYVTAGIDIFSNPAIRKLVFRTELTLLMSKNEFNVVLPNASNVSLKQTFDEMSVVFTPQIMYHLYNKENIKVFFGVGAGINYSIYSNNVYQRTTSYNSGSATVSATKDFTDLSSFHFSLPFSAGVVLNKNIEVIAGYTMRSSITRYVYYSIGLERYRIGVNYLFGKH